MDPNETYRLFCKALLEENAAAAREAHQTLATWIDRGGFEPTWGKAARRQFFTFNPSTGRLS